MVHEKEIDHFSLFIGSSLLVALLLIIFHTMVQFVVTGTANSALLIIPPFLIFMILHIFDFLSSRGLWIGFCMAFCFSLFGIVSLLMLQPHESPLLGWEITCDEYENQTKWRWMTEDCQLHPEKYVDLEGYITEQVYIEGNNRIRVHYRYNSSVPYWSTEHIEDLQAYCQSRYGLSGVVYYEELVCSEEVLRRTPKKKGEE